MKFYAPKYKQLDLGLLLSSLEELDKTNLWVALGTSHALQAVPRGPRDGELVNKRRATVAHVMVNECPNG